MAHNDQMEPIYAKIYGNDTVQVFEECSEESVQSPEVRVTIVSAGGSVTIKVTEQTDSDDTLQAS